MVALGDLGPMRPRFVGRLGLADVITVANAVLGLLAVVALTVDPRLSARLILLAAMGDGLDGLVARRTGGTDVGPYLDSLSDVAAFGIPPALLVFWVTVDGWDVYLTSLTPALLGSFVVPAAFLGVAVIRLGFYTIDDTAHDYTEGIQSTLAATIIAALVLAGVASATVVVVVSAIVTYLMVVRVRYPDLLARDTFVMGVVQGLAVLVPDAFGRAFPYALLVLSLAYVTLAPRFYWRPSWPPE